MVSAVRMSLGDTSWLPLTLIVESTETGGVALTTRFGFSGFVPPYFIFLLSSVEEHLAIICQWMAKTPIFCLAPC